MYVYVIRPEGLKYDVCENGTMIEDGSGLCMVYPAYVTTDFINSSANLLADLNSNTLVSESSSQTKSPFDGKRNENILLVMNENNILIKK